MDIAICDDNQSFLNDFAKQVREIPLVDEIFCFSDDHAFLFSLDAGKKYDAVLLDIEWGPERTGLDIAEEVYKLSPHTKIIYVTGHSEMFAQRIFLHKANLSGFLTKPVNPALLYANLKKVAEAIPHQEQPTLVLRQRGAPVSIPIPEILYIESHGHTVAVHLAQERVVAYERLDSLLQMLPPGFHQCHKSFIVNMGQIRRFQPNDILLKNGAMVPISRSRYAETKAAYFQYMGQSF